LAVLTCAGLLLLAWLGGRRLLTLSRQAPDPLYSLGLGLAAISYLTLAAGLAGWLQRPISLLLLGVWLLFALPELRHLRQIRLPQRSLTLDRWLVALPLLVGLLALGNLIGALAPPAHQDTLRYQLAAPQWWLRHGRIDFVPMLNFNEPPLTQSLYALALLLQGDQLAGLLNLIFGWGAAALLYRMTRRYLGPRVGWMATALFYAMPAVTAESTATSVDLTFTFYALLALDAALRSAEESKSARQWAGMAGVCVGLAAASKLHGLFVMAATGALLLWLRWQRAHALGESRITILLLSYALGTLTALPWYLRNALLTGDPFYPYLYSWLHSRAWSDLGVTCLTQRSAEAGLGHDLWAYLRGPWDLTVHGAAFQFDRAGILPVLLALSPALPLAWRSADQTGRRILAAAAIFSLVYYSLWFLTYEHGPHLLPIVPVLALLTAAGATALERAGGVRRWLALTVVAISLMVGIGANLASNGQTLPVVLDRQSQADYLRTRTWAYDAIVRVNETLPPDARLLTTVLAGYYLNVDYLWAHPCYQAVLDYRAISSPEALQTALRESGITHVLLDDVGLRWAAKSYAKATGENRVGILFAQAEAAGYLRPLWRVQGRYSTSRVLGTGLPDTAVLYQVRD